MSTVDFQDVSAYLGDMSPVNDAKLVSFIEVAESMVASLVGPLEPTAVTSRVSGGGGLVLPVLPVVSVTSVTSVYGVALDVSTLVVDAAGVVGYTYGGVGCGSAPFWGRSYTVVYVAGWAVLPAPIVHAVKELTRHLWVTQRGSGTRRPGSAPEEPGVSFTMPRRVLELLAPYVLPGVA